MGNIFDNRPIHEIIVIDIFDERTSYYRNNKNDLYIIYHII